MGKKKKIKTEWDIREENFKKLQKENYTHDECTKYPYYKRYKEIVRVNGIQQTEGEGNKLYEAGGRYEIHLNSRAKPNLDQIESKANIPYYFGFLREQGFK